MPVERFHFRLSYGHNGDHLTLEPFSHRPSAHPEARHSFIVEMCLKPLNLGQGRSLSQMWINRNALNPNGGQVGAAYHEITRYYRERCRSFGTGPLTEKQLETYLLAKLYPHAKKITLNRVIHGASLKPEQHMIARKELDELLKGADKLTSSDFRKQAEGLIVNKPSTDERLLGTYRMMLADLVSIAKRDMAADQADLPAVMEQWRQWLGKFIRRSKGAPEPDVMDILSAEARAAFSICYSAFWFDLLALVDAKRQDWPWSVFHRLWHLEMVWLDPDDQRKYLTLFAGNCLALHPAASIFIQTKRGRELLGDAVFSVKPGEELNNLTNDKLQRLLYGLSLAMFAYKSAHEEGLSARREQARRKALKARSRPSKRRKSQALQQDVDDR
jgi:hypothetical protein